MTKGGWLLQNHMKCMSQYNALKKRIELCRNEVVDTDETIEGMRSRVPWRYYPLRTAKAVAPPSMSHLNTKAMWRMKCWRRINSLRI